MRLIFSHEPLTWLVVALHGIDVGIDAGYFVPTSGGEFS
jgi:hypothetical protein